MPEFKGSSVLESQTYQHKAYEWYLYKVKPFIEAQWRYMCTTLTRVYKEMVLLLFSFSDVFFIFVIKWGIFIFSLTIPYYQATSDRTSAANQKSGTVRENVDSQ